MKKKIYIVIIIIGKTKRNKKKKNKKSKKTDQIEGGKQKRGSEQALVSYGKE